ncbi:beta-phosphoglucomutase [Longirhabdus pacifica]|uniref:beta-phosphoglucomutase n=1 Tax=Longirhabdus pacifica TaxID=2305227 RepID=UPI001008F2D5|nr:beta-phosphoglucomutase [Longirhabdus pacifica]
MTAIQACIFDLDGVIVDTAKYHYLAWNKLANKLGFTFTEEQNEQLKGVSRMRSLDILLEIGGLQLDDETKNQLAQEKNECYLEYIHQMDETEILPGVKTFIESIRQAGIKTALGSASKNAMVILENMNMLDDFEVIIDGNKVSNAKPDPEVFLQAAKALNVDPSHCVVFEDAEAGIEAAIRAKMYTIGVGESNSLEKANYSISSFLEMSLDRLPLEV